jgi:N-acetylmuramic acid 6-phosphate etherase
MLTESTNPRSAQIDTLPTLDILKIINAEDATVAMTIASTLPAIAQAVDAIVAGFRQGGRLLYIGAGTSGRLGVLDAVECVPTFSALPEMVQGIVAGGQPALTRSIEGAEDDPDGGRRDILALSPGAHDVVVGIAASGRTPYVLGAMAAAKAAGATTVGVACNVPAPLLDAVDIPIGVPVGPEIVAGSTRMKSGTAQKMVLNMLSTASMIKLGKVYRNLMVDVMVTNEKLAIRARNMVAEITGLDADEAAAVLARTNNEVKTAVVVALLDVSPDEARERLDRHNGMLRAVIEEK